MKTLKNALLIGGLASVIGFSGCENEKTQGMEYSKIKSGKYFVDLEVKLNCSAVVGERSSSCCRNIEPISLRVPVDSASYSSLRQGTYVENMVTNGEEYLKHVKVVGKGISDTTNN